MMEMAPGDAREIGLIRSSVTNLERMNSRFAARVNYFGAKMLKLIPSRRSRRRF
jgi:hypothetical protein